MKLQTGRQVTIGILICFSILAQYSYDQTKPADEQRIAQWKDWIKKYPPSKGSMELESIFSFPDMKLLENGVYLWGSNSIERDQEGNFYVLDAKWKSLFKFDTKGVFIKKMGRSGQGPGEFMNPFSMCITSTRVIISDTSKYEIIILDLELNIKKSIKVFRAYIDIAMSESGNIYGVPFRKNNEMPLIDVMNEEGKLLYSFGKAMFGNEKDWQIPNMVKISINEYNEVFVAFEHFATVCKYEPNGQLASVFKIDHKAMRERERANLKSIENDDRTYWPVINAIRAVGKGFAIMHNAPFTQVMEYDANGYVNEQYWVIRSYDYKACDFVMSKGNGKTGISLLLENPENKIEVLRPKN